MTSRSRLASPLKLVIVMPEFEPDTIVTAEIAGEEVPGMVVGEGELKASYGLGPELYYPVEVPGAGTYNVAKSDITAPTT